MNSPEATIILKSPGGSWTSVGTETSRGIVPEGITVTANEFGPDTCSFSLRREASLPWPDLLAFNQADVIVGGTLVWGGRIWEAPVSDGDEDVVAVNGRGWQYHLDDDLLQRCYVNTDLAPWRDIRSFPTAPLATFPASPVVITDRGGISLGWANASPWTAFTGMGVQIDLDALGGVRPERVVVTYTTLNASSTFTYIIRTSDTDNPLVGTPSDYANAGMDTLGASGTLNLTTTGVKRYLTLFLYVGSSGTTGADHMWKITGITLFALDAYESGGLSVLKASQVVTDVLASGALPLLDSSTANIGTTAFSIPVLAPSGYQTPRSIIAAANAFEGNLYGVDAERKAFLRERDEFPKVEVGSWPGASFQDASTNSADGLYNRVIVQGTGPDGSPIAEIRTAVSSLLNRQGFTRTAVLSAESALTTLGAQELGDIWLHERVNPPLKGSLVVSGWGGARYVNGGDVHPSEMLLRYGQRIRLGQLVDPSTGDQGRDGIIKSVSYSHDTETASLELDSERGRLETLLSRLAVVTSQIR